MTPADHLAALGADEMHRRAALAAGAACTSAALALPTTVPAATRTGRVGVGAVGAARIHEITPQPADLEDRFGGGQATSAP